MDDTTETDTTDTTDTSTETEERATRARKTVPIRIFVGGDLEGWRPVPSSPTFAEEREAWRWVERNGGDGLAYQPMRAYGARRVVPRRLEVVGDEVAT